MDLVFLQIKIRRLAGKFFLSPRHWQHAFIRVRNTLNKAGGLPQAGDNRMVIRCGMFNFTAATLYDLNRGFTRIKRITQILTFNPPTLVIQEIPGR